MFILKPLKSILFTKEDVGTVEEVVRETKLVDKGIDELTRFSRNAPIFDPERRKFFKHAAVLAGLYATGQLLKGCATVQEPVTFQGKKYAGWEAWLMSEHCDLIRGPPVLIHPSTGLPSDFRHHQERWINEGFGAVDYDVPIGTPIVPTADTFRTRIRYSSIAGNQLYLPHRYKPGNPIFSLYTHLDRYVGIIYKGQFRASVGGAEIRDQQLDTLKIVAFSGNTGIGPGGGPMPEHLHFQITGVEPGGQAGQGTPIPPGVDPFQLGIDADKPFGGVDKYPRWPPENRPVVAGSKPASGRTVFS